MCDTAAPTTFSPAPTDADDAGILAPVVVVVFVSCRTMDGLGTKYFPSVEAYCPLFPFFSSLSAFFPLTARRSPSVPEKGSHRLGRWRADAWERGGDWLANQTDRFSHNTACHNWDNFIAGVTVVTSRKHQRHIIVVDVMSLWQVWNHTQIHFCNVPCTM